VKEVSKKEKSLIKNDFEKFISSTSDHYIPLQEIEELYASTPWQFLIDKISSTSSSKVEEQQQQPSSSSSASSTKGSRRNSSSPTTGATMIKNTLTEEEKQFIEKNACAIWERTHWFPIKCATGKNEEENRLIKWHHNRRKRRQARLKHDFDKALEEKKNETNMTIFNSRIYEKILLQKPRTWCPLEKNGHLIEQVVQLDQNEPDRLDCL
jgi:hypothetical protein